MTTDATKGFILYYDYRQHLALLNDEERGKLLMHLIDYGETKQEPKLEGAMRMAFSFMRAQIDRDADKYAEIKRKRQEAGKRGGRPSEKKDEAENQSDDEKPSESNANQSEAKKANGFEENQSEAKKANGFEENQSEAKKAITITNTSTNTSTKTNTRTITSTNTNTNVSPLGETNIPPKGGNTPEAPPAADRVPHKAIVELYHGICKSYPKLRSLTQSRKEAISARWKEHGQNLETFRELFERAEASAFLKGNNAKKWTADFNWLMNSSNMAKVLEGNYNNDRGGAQSNGAINGYAERREPAATAPTLSGFTMAGE